jgi:sugar lactone lactonase YvrE
MKAKVLSKTACRVALGCMRCACLGILVAHFPVAVMGQSVYTTPYTFTTLAGLARNGDTNDGSGSAARFFGPSGVAVDSMGNVYVADTQNQTIRKVTQAGVVITLAGRPQFQGTNDGTGVAARFGYPTGIAADTDGNIYVSDTSSSTIRKVAASGTNWLVTTLAGQPGIGGTNDGTNAGARFYGPTGVAVDGATNIYVADYVNYTIRKVTPMGTNWVVTTIAGLGGSQGTNDGTNADARFGGPRGAAVDTNGNVYVADGGNTIRKLTPEGTNWVVTTLAGLGGSSGTNDGTNGNARFNYPSSVAIDTNGNLYITDDFNSTIRKVMPVGTNWVVTTPAGLPGTFGTNDGTGSVAQFYAPQGVAVDTNGCLYVADTQNNTIRKGYPPGSVPAPVLQSPSVSAGQFGFGIAGLPNLAVDVQSSSDLINWQTVAVAGYYYVLVGGTNFFPDPNPPQGNEFYRVRVR